MADWKNPNAAAAALVSILLAAAPGDDIEGRLRGVRALGALGGTGATETRASAV